MDLIVLEYVWHVVIILINTYALVSHFTIVRRLTKENNRLMAEHELFSTKLFNAGMELGKAHKRLMELEDDDIIYDRLLAIKRSKKADDVANSNGKLIFVKCCRCGIELVDLVVTADSDSNFAKRTICSQDCDGYLVNDDLVLMD